MKRSRFYIACILVLVMSVLTPLQSFAASDNKTYVSEITAVTADSFDSAKSKLEAAGYKAVENGNINSSLKTGVYLGYKETTDPDEAVTDIAAMNMKGKYSYSDYKELMEKYSSRIKDTVEGLEASIQEFQTNYYNDTGNALMAYASLNLYKDDDSGKLIGDYFLDYDFSDKSRQELIDSFMQANTDIVMNIIRIVTFAADPDEKTVIDRMSETSSEAIRDRYIKNSPSVAKGEQALAAALGEITDKILENWDLFNSYLCDVEKQFIKLNADGSIDPADGVLEQHETELPDMDGMPEELKEHVGTLYEISDAAETVSDETDFILYSLLAETVYGDGTLLDYFKRSASEVKREEIYPLAEAMSDAQRAQFDYTGLKDLLMSAFSSIENTDEEAEEMSDVYIENAEKAEPKSIYQGVDRSVFEEGVALTGEAVQHETVSEESWFEKLTGAFKDDNYRTSTTITGWAAAGGLFGAGMASAAVHFLQKYHAAGNRTRIVNNFRKFSSLVFDEVSDNADDVYVVDGIVDAEDSVVKDAIEFENKGMGGLNAAVSNAGRIAKYVAVGCFILMAIAVAYDIYTLVQYFKTQDPQEEAIPHHIVAAAETEYGTDYIYYQTVKDLNGEPVDANNHEADKAKAGWLVLYTTKEKGAGKPILAKDLKVSAGTSGIENSGSFAHLFNEKGALNFIDQAYTGVSNDSSGIYLLFSRSTSGFAGSAVSGGTAVLMSGGGLIIGLAGGFLISSALRRRKERKTAAV